MEVGRRKMTLSHLGFFSYSTIETLDPDLLISLSTSFQTENRAPSTAGANHLPASWLHSKSTLSDPAGL